jgi:hypothetical protein
LRIFETGSLFFAGAGLELWSSCSLPPEKLGLQVWATSVQPTTHLLKAMYLTDPTPADGHRGCLKYLADRDTAVMSIWAYGLCIHL